MANLTTVGSALGKVGSVTISGSVIDGYIRTKSASGYNRINPFQVANSAAPAEFAEPHNLGDWDGYSHITLNAGARLAKSGSGYQKQSITWTKPTGYDNDPTNLVQRAYWKSMGTSEALSTNPFSSPTGTANAGTGGSYTITGLTGGNYYAIGVKVEWNDSTTTYENADSVAYNYSGSETPLIGGGRGISSGKIYSKTPTMSGVTQNTAPGSCIAGCTSCVEIRVNVIMEGLSTGTLQEKIGAGSWSTINSSLGSGTSSITLSNKDAQVTYSYRLRYNDVSPDSWSATKQITTECILL